MTSSCSSSSSSGPSDRFPSASGAEHALKHRFSICQLSGATGLLVTSRIIIVSAHVLSQPKDADGVYARFEIEHEDFGPKSTHVRLNPHEDQGGFFYSSPYPPRDKSEPKLRKYSIETLDFTLVALDQNDPHFKEIQGTPIKFFERPVPPQYQESVYVAQYPSFDKDPITKKWTTFPREQKFVSTAEAVAHISEWVIHYNGDAVRGSSGAPLFNGSEEVIGFHHAECEEDTHANKNCKIAIRADGIREHIYSTLMPQSTREIFITDSANISIIESLKTFYRKKENIKLLVGGKLSIKAHYTSLKMITNNERKETEKELKKPNHRLTRDETIFQLKGPIQLEDLFEKEELKNALKKRVLIQGSAGIGKSTLCQRIVYLWTHDNLWTQFKAVIWIKFRNLTVKKHPDYSDLYEVIAKECLLKPSITHLLQEEKFRKGCLLILDGYDELPNENLEFQAGGKYCQVLKAFQEEFPHIIVTTRPQSVPGFQGSLELQILGFENQSINKYVESFFRLNEQDSEEERTKKQKGNLILKEQLKHPLVFSLCHIPINLEIFCSLALEGQTFLVDRPLGIAKIYDKLTDWLMRRFFLLRTGMKRETALSPFPQSRGDIKNAMQALEELAWKGFSEDRLYFNNTDDDPEISSVFFKHNIDDITEVTKIGPFEINNGEGQFIHFTFQEFFSAKYLVRLVEDLEANELEIMKIIQDKKFHPRYQLVFSMTSGLLAQNKNKNFLRKFFDMLYAPPTDEGKVREFILFAKYFEECGVSAREVTQYEQFTRDIVRLLEDPQIFYETKLEILNKNSFLLANDKVANFFLQRLNNPHSSFLYFLIELAKQKTRIPEGIPKEKILKGIFSLLLDSSSDISVREMAAGALWEIAGIGGVLPEKTLDVLVSLLLDPTIDVSVHEKAAWALGAIGKAGGALPEKALNGLTVVLLDSDADEFVRACAALTMWKIVKAGGVLPEKVLDALIAVLLDSNAWALVRGYAKGTLETIVEAGGDLANKALDGLIGFLSDPKIDTYLNLSATVQTLEKIVKPRADLSERMLNGLITLLFNSSANADIRGQAAQILAEIVLAEGIHSEKALNGLIVFFLDPKSDVNACKEATEASGKIARAGGVFPEKILNRLVDLLSDSSADEFVRGAAARSLRGITRIGTIFLEEMLDGMIVLISDSSVGAFPRKAAAGALGEIARLGMVLPEKALDGFMLLLSDASVDVDARRHAAEVLGTIARTEVIFPEKVLEGLTALLSDSNADVFVQGLVAEALGDIAATGKVLPEGLLDRLMNLLFDSSADKFFRRESAAKALEMSVRAGGDLADKALDSLMNVLLDSSTDALVHEAVAKVLRNIVETGKALPETKLDELMDFLLNFNAHVEMRGRAAVVLGMFVRTGEGLPEKTLDSLMNVLLNPSSGVLVHEVIAKVLRNIAGAGKALPGRLLDNLIALLSNLNASAEVRRQAASILQQCVKKGIIHSKNDIVHICKINGMAFYEMENQYYIVDEREVHPVKIAATEPVSDP